MKLQIPDRTVREKWGVDFRLIFSLCFFMLISFSSIANSEPLKLCIDSRDWYPFSFVEKGQVRGIHIDIVKTALGNLGYHADITPFPRKRCIVSISKNWSDGMISLAYHSELQDDFDFPPDSSERKESWWRIMQVDHMLVTSVTQGIRFKGDLGTLPIPVRIPAGERLTMDLGLAPHQIDDSSSDGEKNIRKLLRDKRGGVIITSVLAEILMRKMDLEEKIIIHSTPINSSSYHLAFSKESGLHPEERMKIWQEIGRLREDYVFILQLFSKY